MLVYLCTGAYDNPLFPTCFACATCHNGEGTSRIPQAFLTMRMTRVTFLGGSLPPDSRPANEHWANHKTANEHNFETRG